MDSLLEDLLSQGGEFSNLEEEINFGDGAAVSFMLIDFVVFEDG